MTQVEQEKNQRYHEEKRLGQGPLGNANKGAEKSAQAKQIEQNDHEISSVELPIGSQGSAQGSQHP